MTIRQARDKARDLKVKNYAKLSKDQLIWAIQKAEGNDDCYKRIENCGQMNCCWRSGCQV